ncbi:MAG TPA: GntR family transcriptional regulator [Geminicoccus sp.]|jgi:DNA-binding GntR family transcriptional regulator|uniref:GntR family transcriptional regulator n=1 Tax=Geminicoccus sp. TaxID=2024832 RepID=UPI002E3240C2|nr:GntR family transcriptional regulator [Geminicoccus sp.]HEX2525023.1 GntR family transcriptional regulator [Geminicoccus sp.]
MTSSDPINESLQSDEKRPIKAGQVAYQRFKEMLFAQRIQTGAVLTQAELMTLLDVPIGPLREALQSLENEGLVTMLPRSGIRIVKPDLTLIRNAFQLRRIIECEAVRKFAERATLAEIDRWIERHRSVMEKSQAGMAAEALMEEASGTDAAFHTVLVASLRNPLIDEIYERTKDQIRLIRLDNLYLLSGVAVANTMMEHLRILEAARLRDHPAVVRAMEDHLAASLHRAIGL